MRSSSVSIEPNIIVAVVGIPRSCASRITPIHSSGCILRAEIRLRTRSTKISAPAPGSDFMPAARSRSSTWRGSLLDLRETVISETESEWISTSGNCARTRRTAARTTRSQLRIDAALDHDLRRAVIGRVLDAREDLVVRHRVAFAVFLGAEERAERTVHVADIGVVDGGVDDVGYDLGRVQAMRRALAAAPSSCSGASR